MPEYAAHDALFRRAFSEPDVAAGLLRSHLPPALAGAIDWSTLDLAPSDFVDDALGERRNDLLFHVEIAGAPAFLYVLLEHQSTADPWMPLRLLRYVLRVWDTWLAAHPDAERLPPVLPIVVHHDRRPWSAPTRLTDLVDLPDGLAEHVRPRLPELDVFIDELTDITDEQLADRALDAFAELTIRALTRLRFGGDAVAELTRWLPLLRVMWQEPHGLPRLRALLQYVGWRTDARAEDVAEVLGRVGPGAREDYMTSLNQRLIDEGLERGRNDGESAVILRLLTLRFGELGPAIEARVGQATSEERARWAERILTAATLDDVFA